MRVLIVNASEDPVNSEVLLALQLRTANEPFLPRLKCFECEEAGEELIPFIPLFLSPKIVDISIGFDEDSPALTIAFLITRLSTLCPDLNYVTLTSPARDSVIIDAVSELLLTCNRDSLKFFRVDSPLTEEAREVIYQLPKLSQLWAVIQGPTPLPPVALPDLTLVDIEYGDSLEWLEGFREATLGKLEVACFRSESKQIGTFLGHLKVSHSPPPPRIRYHRSDSTLHALGIRPILLYSRSSN
jgi:hypothetical protein